MVVIMRAPKKCEIRVIVKILTKNLQKKIHENKNYRNKNEKDFKYEQKSIKFVQSWKYNSEKFTKKNIQEK